MTDPARRPQSEGVNLAAATLPAQAAEPEANRTAAEFFRATYQTEFVYVWHSLRRLGVREADLEDLAHDVFVIFYRTLERFDRNRATRPWLYGIAFRVASDYRRKASFRREVPVEDRDPPARTPLPPDELEARERRALVMQGLDALSMEQRAVFVMVELQEHSVVDVAEALSIKENTAYSRLRLARRKFAAAVRRVDARRGNS